MHTLRVLGHGSQGSSTSCMQGRSTAAGMESQLRKRLARTQDSGAQQAQTDGSVGNLRQQGEASTTTII